MPPLSQQPKKNRHIPPQSQKLTLREQVLETQVPCDMAKHAAREKQPGGRYKSVKEFIFPQTSAETYTSVLWLSIFSWKGASLTFLSRGIKNVE